MIRTFCCQKTERLFNRERVLEFVNIAVVAQRRLLALNNALALTDLRIPPSNRLEALREDRQRTAQYPHQRSVPYLLHLERGRTP